MKIPGHWKEKLPPKGEVENSEHGLYIDYIKGEVNCYLLHLQVCILYRR